MKPLFLRLIGLNGRNRSYKVLAHALLWLPILTLAAASPDPNLEARHDINPALLYWQAYALLPDLKEEENQRVSDRHAVQPDKETRALAARFDQSFKVLHRAIAARVACDWGVDLSFGPEAMLPQLAKAKRLAQASTFRANVFLIDGQETKAVDDWVAAFVLGRQLPTDGILISTLVQLAIENIVVSAVAENYYRLSTETLQQLWQRLEAAPPRLPIARSVATEKIAFVDWYVKKMEGIRARNAGNEIAAMTEAKALISATLAQEENQTNFVADLVARTGETIGGMIEYFKRAGEPYERLAAICALPYAEYQQQLGPFQSTLQSDDHLLVNLLLPAITKSREKEFIAIARFAMFQAAVSYRVGGASALQQLPDPFGSGPFRFRRIVHNGIDRGFELGSELNYRGFPEVLVFIETAGPPLHVNGPKAGTPITAK